MNNSELLKQKKIVQQRLSYHFGRVGGGWIVDDMPFLNEFLNEVNKLCEMIENKGGIEMSCDTKEINGINKMTCETCQHENDYTFCSKCLIFSNYVVRADVK